MLLGEKLIILVVAVVLLAFLNLWLGLVSLVVLGVYSLANFDLLPFGQYNYLFSIFTMVVGVACIFLAYVDTTD